MIRLTFVLGRGLSSYWIARFGFSTDGWSHVAPTLPDGSYIDARSDRIWVENPKGGGRYIDPGVRRRPAHYEAWKRWAVVAIPSTLRQEHAAYDFLGRQEGHLYDCGAIEGFLTGLRLHRRGDFICSALGVDFCRHAGVIQKSRIPDYEVSPDALYLLTTSLPGAKIEASHGL